MTATPKDDVLFERPGRIGMIVLNRPRALNALTLDMMRAIHQRLDAWASDDGVSAVVIRGAGERGFCAGGDVVSLYHDGLAAKRGEGTGLTDRLFRAEFSLNHRIHTFPKPYVSLLHGFTMGGGFGLSVHGSHRVASETIVFAMQETAIGLFPDVGGGWFLPRCPGETGTYLGLTGQRCGIADCRHIGYVTHAVAGDRLAAIAGELAEADWTAGEATAVVEAVLARHVRDTGPAPLAEHGAAIDRCFGFGTVEAIMAALAAEGTEWAAETAQLMASRSPTSLKIALRQIRLGKSMPYSNCVTMEFRMSQACMDGHDFYEGIRAVLIDKDKSPRWSPAELAGVGDDLVDRHFRSLGDQDLIVAP